ncbi:MAG TPA: chemotaxis protein CheA [Gemmatimonadaceae bacterium]|nr:chemotaxis protein CheA [Gemmatimonadaceae bacterium]
MVGGGEFFQQFIDDYFSECDELLATLRRTLLAIDTDARPEALQLQEIARALHTLKGLSGMVGLAAVEQTAHAMEDLVRALATTATVNRALVELLFAGEAALEAGIEARRKGEPAPSADEYVEQVGRAIAGSSAATSHALTVHRPGPVSCHFEFAPSAELAARGIGVEVVRQRLISLGNITSIVPRVKQSGGVIFEFAVAMNAGSAPEERWRDDGMSWSWDTGGAQVAAPAPRVEPAPQPVSAMGVGSNMVRVDLARLDDLMRMVGELVIMRARLGESLAHLSSGAGAPLDDLHEANDRIEHQLRTIREGVMRIRLVSVGEVFERMRFAMRDVAREAGKSIRLEFSGQETQIDKLVVDRMLEPLLHLVRNSASHGIENPAERRARGKPDEGVIHLRAQAAGDRIVLEIEDDGGGIDTSRVVKRATEMGLVRANAELLPDALLDIICTPGFSTRETADLASGRGVGMSVVRTTIRALGGELFVHSELGRGTRFTIELPLTLMITDALLVEIGDQAMAIPQVTLREIVPYEQSLVTRFENNEVLSYRERVVPLVNLATLFHLRSQPDARRYVLIVGSDTHLAGLVVDRLVGLREIVVHPLTDPLTAVPGVAGATELPDGRVSLILDAAALVRRSRESAVRGRQPVNLPARTTPTLTGVHTWS